MLVIKDFATTTLASALTAVATTITASDASRLPALTNGDYFYLVLQKFVDRSFVEIVKVTGVAGNELTVVRAQGGTSGKAFSIGDYAELRVTVDTFAEYVQQSTAGKVDKVGGVVTQSLGLLNAADLVQAAVSIAYDVTNGHGTILSGGEGANKITPYLALRPLGKSDASRELKYDTAGTLTLTGGSRVIVSGMLLSTHVADANGWPNAINSDPNNYINRARSRIAVDNNALHFIGDGATNSRRLGIQAGHASAPYATSYGTLELNPYGGAVKVNGGTVYHTGYVPTPAAVGALALVGGTLTGSLGVRPSVGVNPLDLFSTPNPAGTSAQGVAGWDNTGATREWGVGRYATAGVAEYAYFGFGTSPWNSGLRVYGAGDIRAGAVNRLYHEGYLPTPDVLGAVPQARTINSKPLTSNITLSAADVGAVAVADNTYWRGRGQRADLNTADNARPGYFSGTPTSVGMPVAGIYGHGLTVGPGNDAGYGVWYSQILFGHNNRIYTRNGVNGAAAGAWNYIFTSTDKPTAADVGAVAKTGDTMTGNLTAPTFTGALVGDAATATKLLTARTINGTDFDGTANITTANWGTARTLTIGNSGKSVDGSANVSWSLAEIGAAPASHTHNTIVSVDNRALKPSGSVARALNMYFTSKGGLTGTADTVYGDLLVLNGYSDTTGGVQNALFFGKTAQEIIHYQGAIGATQWSSARTIAYTSSNVASATKLQTARTINGTDFDGSGNITTANWGTARTLTIGDAAKSVNGAGDVSWSLSEIGAVPQARTINTKPLTSDVVLSAADVGALPIAGGSLAGSVNLYPSAPQEAVTGLRAAPLMRQHVNVGVVSSFIPFGHMTAQSSAGYITHLNFGLYKRGVGTWDGSGMYVATGGSDGSPTEFFLLKYGGDISHSRGHTFYHTGFKPTAADVGAVPQARTINSKPLTADITLSAADVGALPVTGGTLSGVLGVTAELRLVGGSASDMADIVWGAPDGTERGRLWIGGTIGADNSLTWRSGASGATHKIYHEGNKPTASDVGAVKQNDRFVANNAVGNDYHQCAIEVNGNTAIDSRPGIGFHMSGRFASTLHLWEGGDFRFHTQGLGSYAGIVAGNVNANDVYIRSDRRLKKNLVEVRDALRKVSSLTAYSYDKKQTLEATEYDKKEVGLIAQDVEQVLPEAVTRVVDSSNKDGTEILTLSNSALIALLVGAVKELSEKVKELEYGRT